MSTYNNLNTILQNIICAQVSKNPLLWADAGPWFRVTTDTEGTIGFNNPLIKQSPSTGKLTHTNTNWGVWTPEAVFWQTTHFSLTHTKAGTHAQRLIHDEISAATKSNNHLDDGYMSYTHCFTCTHTWLLRHSEVWMQTSVTILCFLAQLSLPIKNIGIKINTKILPDNNLLLGGCIIDFSIIRGQSIQFKALSRKMGLWNWFKGTMITCYYRIKMAQGSIVLLLQYFNKWPSSNGSNAGSDVIRFPDAGDVGA